MYFIYRYGAWFFTKHKIIVVKITLEIKSCKECPHFKRERMWTEDSWEEAYNWFCLKANGKEIQGYVEWRDNPEIPTWCPAKVKE